METNIGRKQTAKDYTRCSNAPKLSRSNIILLHRGGVVYLLDWPSSTPMVVASCGVELALCDTLLAGIGMTIKLPGHSMSVTQYYFNTSNCTILFGCYLLISIVSK